MTTISYSYKITNAEVNDEHKNLIESKFASLEKFIMSGSSRCQIEFAKETHHHHGSIFRVEANLDSHGKVYRAEAMEESFERGIDVVRDELERELQREHDKRDTLVKRGGRIVKNMLRFGS